MDLLTSIQSRKDRRSAFGYGITTADSYLKHIQSCAGESACRINNPWSGAADAPGWDAVVKEAASKLVYSNESTNVKSDTVVTNSSDFRKALADSDIEVPPRTIMVFQNVVTTPSKDRDGDILRTDGAEIDQAMPLLWQHMHVAPIGRMLEVVEHSHDKLLVTSAVIDSALGNDTANLIEFGALRISHGFIPLEFHELEVKDGEVPGFDITRFEIMEESVVSVPSNTDAVIEAVSRGKLADPLVKEWANYYYNNRPLTVAGVDMGWTQTDTMQKHVEDVKIGDGYVTLTLAAENQGQHEEEEMKTVEDQPEPITPKEAEKSSCECQHDDQKDKAAKPYPNEHACRLQSPDKFDDYRRDERESGGKVYSIILGHNPDTDKWEEQAFRYSNEEWTEAEARAHCGDHEAMAFEVATNGDAGADVPSVKGGRVLSAQNSKAIEGAVELIEDIAKADSSDVAIRYRVLAKEAARSLTDVLSGSSGSDDEEEKEYPKGDNVATVESVAKQLLIMASDADPNLLKRVALVLSETAAATFREREEVEFKAIIESVL